MNRWIAAFLFVIGFTPSAWAATPGQIATVTVSGAITNTLVVDATQGLPITIMVAAPSGGTLEVDGAVVSTGPWIPLATVTTKAASDGYNAAGTVLSTTTSGYVFQLPYFVPFIRMQATSLTAGTATLGISQPIIK